MVLLLMMAMVIGMPVAIVIVTTMPIRGSMLPIATIASTVAVRVGVGGAAANARTTRLEPSGRGADPG